MSSSIRQGQFYAPWALIDGKPLQLQWGEIRTDTAETKALVRGSFQDIEDDVDSLNALRALIGQAYGKLGFSNQYRFIFQKATNEFCAQKNDGTEAVPDWTDVFCIRLHDGQFQVTSKGGIQSNAGFYGPIPRELDTIGEIGATGNTQFTRINELFFNTDLGFYLTSIKSGSHKGKPVVNTAFPFGRSKTFSKTGKVWEIRHGYGVTPVMVQVMNDHDVVVIPDKIDVSDINSAWFYFNTVTSGKVMIATGGSGAAALIPINPFYLAVRTSGQSADEKVMRDNVDLIFDKNFFYVNVNLDPPGGSHKRAEVSFISGSDTTIMVSDGSNNYTTDTVNFNSDEFYLTSNLTGKPVVNLEVFDKSQTFGGTVTAEAFYLAPGSGGELSKSGNDVLIKSFNGQVVIDDELLVTNKIVAEAFYTPDGGDLASPTTDHGTLLGLSDDDHALYLNRSGVRAMTGDFDLGDNNIQNIGLIEGDLHVDGDVTAEAFYILPAGEISSSGDDLHIKSSSHQVVIDNSLRVVGKAHIDGDATAEAFYILPVGEISSSGDDLLLKTRQGQVVIEDSLRVTDKVVAERFYLIDGGEVGEIVTRIISYAGTGSDPISVTLTGINRTHSALWMLNDATGSNPIQLCMPAGTTGTSFVRRRSSDGDGVADLDFDAPIAGTSQIVTINNNITAMNASGRPYLIQVIGTRT